MGTQRSQAGAGKEAAAGLRKESAREESKVEAEKGSDLKKGAERFDERSQSADGRSAGEKQRE